MVMTADTLSTFSSAKAAGNLPAPFDAFFEEHVWSAHTPSTNVHSIVFEGGLDTLDLPKNESTAISAIRSNGLHSRRYYVDMDQRLFNQIWAPEPLPDGRGHVLFANKTDTGDFVFEGVNVPYALGASRNGMTEIFNYIRTDINAMPMPTIYTTDSAVTPLVSTVSVISGS